MSVIAAITVSPLTRFLLSSVGTHRKDIDKGALPPIFVE
jgi:hypothetical protein